jgi:hypothetical protein
MEPIAIPVLAGLAGTVLTALLSRLNLSSTQKRWAAIGVFVVLTGFGVWAWAHPASWETVAVWLAAGVGAGQTVFAALKPTGVLNWLTGGDTDNGKHVA